MVVIGLLGLIMISGATAAVLSNILTANVNLTSDLPITLSWNVPPPSPDIGVGYTLDYTIAAEVGAVSRPILVDWTVTITAPVGFIAAEHLIVKDDAGNVMTDGNNVYVFDVDLDGFDLYSTAEFHYMHFTIEFAFGAPSGAYTLDIEVVGGFAP